MRIKHKVNVKIADDTDMKDVLFALDDTLAEVVVDSYTKMTASRIKVVQIEDTEENQETYPVVEEVPLGDIEEVKGIFLKLDGEALVYLNGSTDGIQLRKHTTGSSVYAKLFVEADITKVEIQPAESETVNGIFCAWGDAAE